MNWSKRFYYRFFAKSSYERKINDIVGYSVFDDVNKSDREIIPMYDVKSNLSREYVNFWLEDLEDFKLALRTLKCYKKYILNTDYEIKYHTSSNRYTVGIVVPVSSELGLRVVVPSIYKDHAEHGMIEFLTMLKEY